MMRLQKIEYSALNAKAQEMYNFQKVSAVLADYGFTTMWLNNDWQGADFLAVHADGVTFIKIQLKGRLSFSKKYIGKDIYVCFTHKSDVYLYPHDLVLSQLEHRIADRTYLATGSWSGGTLTEENKELLKPYLL